MSIAVAPYGDVIPGGAIGALLVALAAFSLVLVVVIVSHRRNRK